MYFKTWYFKTWFHTNKRIIYVYVPKKFGQKKPENVNKVELAKTKKNTFVSKNCQIIRILHSTKSGCSVI